MISNIRTALLLAAGLLVALPVLGDGPADKVTGTYGHAGCADCPVYRKEVVAHEAIGRQPQKGSIYIVRPDGTWNYIDLSASNACVHVYDDGKARIGGLNSDGDGPGIGRFFGWEVEDNGEPAAWVDKTTTVRFDGNAEGRDYFLDWCATGNPTGNTAIFPHMVVDGNLQVHNHGADGD